MNSSSAYRALGTLAGLVIVIAGLKLAAAVLLPILVAFFLSALSLPLLHWLRKRCPDWIAVTVAILASLLFVVGLGFLVSGSISDFITAAPRYRLRFQEILAAAVHWLLVRGIPAGEWVSAENIDPGAFVDFVTSTLKGVASVLTNLLLVVVTMIFVLLEATKFQERVRLAVGPRSEARLTQYSVAFAQIQRYLAIKTVVSALTGVTIGLAMAIVGLDFPILWGLTAFFFNYIPNLGSILAAIPAILLSLVQLGPLPTLVVLLIYVGVNLLLGNIVEPQLLGRRLGLSPLVVFLSLVFWGWVWGPAGMILSVPLTVMARIFFENSRDFRWVAVFLAARPRAVPPAPEMPAASPEPEAARRPLRP
jgi:predicted PurR-regulated permease PerM